MGTHKDAGEVTTAVLHTHRYLNFMGSDLDPNRARSWSNGWIQRLGRETLGGDRLTAKRRYYSPDHTDEVRDRIVYLISNRNLVTGADDLHVCARIHADEGGALTMLSADEKIGDYNGAAQTITIPTAVNGVKLKYFAIASRVQVPTDDVENWLEALSSDIENVFGWADFNYTHTLLGVHEIKIETGTNAEGEVETMVLRAWKLPVFDPLKMAKTMAKTLRDFIVAFEKEFGFHKPLINMSAAKVGKKTKRWAEYRLGLMLDQAQHPELRDRVDDVRPVLNAFLRGRILVQDSHQRCVDLAAANLATWLRRDVVLAWINLCHIAGVSNVSKEKSAGKGRPDAAKICVLEDFAAAIDDLHQTRPGNVLAEILAAKASSHAFLDEYLFTGKAMAPVLKTRKVLESTAKVHKLVFGRLVARGKKDLAAVLKIHGQYLVDAGVLSDVHEITDVSSTALDFLAKGAPGTVTGGKLKVQRASVSLSKMKSRLGKAEAATSVLEMLAWLEVMENIRAYTELAKSGKGATTLDDIKLATAIATQVQATADLLIGQTVQQGSKMGLRVAVSALGVAVNVVDAALKAHEADELAKKGDTDAAAFMMASAIFVMMAIPFGLFGWWIGAAVAIIGGILGMVAELVTDDTWEIFLAHTRFGSTLGNGSASPDWTGGVTLTAMRGNPAFQVRALANLLNNFTVTRLGGAINNKFGYYAVIIQMATPDPKAVFLVRWQFQVAGDATIHSRETVAAAFAGPGKRADGKMFRIPGTLLDPDGKSLEDYEHSWAQEQTATSILVGEPLDMRGSSLPGHKWQSKTIVGLEVSVRRLASQCFAMPRSGDKEWTHTVTVDLRATGQKSRLFNDA